MLKSILLFMLVMGLDARFAFASQPGLPNYGSLDCTQSACRILGAFGCSDQDKLNEVKVACADNHNRLCLEEACRLAGAIACSRRENVLSLAESCGGNFDDQCLKFSCRQLGYFGCDEVEEINEIARSCAQR